MKITVLGDGGWGTALAVLLHEKGNNVCIWSNFPDYAKVLNEKRENIKFLPKIKIPHEIKIEVDMQKATAGSKLIILAVPSKYMRDICKKVGSTQAKCLLSVAKGIEKESNKRMSEIIKEEIPDHPIAVLSGPSHAEEVSKHLPTAVVVAAPNLELAEFVQNIFMSSRFRVYTTTDIVGVELGGTLKNIIAIAAGICEGSGLGDSAKSALMTRGLEEMSRLGIAMRAKRETFSGLAGIGDLIVTCTSKFGRNLRFGKLLTEGKTVQDALNSTDMVVEGASSVSAVFELGKKNNIELPICTEIHYVINKGKNYTDAINDLMKRAPKKETG